MVQFNEVRQKKKIEELRIQEAENLTRILAEKYKIPYLDLSTTPINTDALRLIPEEEARTANIAAFRLIGKTVHVAVSSPESEKVKMALKELERRDYKPVLHLVSKRSLERAWKRYKEISYSEETEAGVLEISNEQVVKYSRELSSLDDFISVITGILKGKKRYRTSHLLEIFIAGALATKASDIHIEPQENAVRLRMRLDGVLHDLLDLEQKPYSLLLSRIKLISGMKLNIKDTSQDGRFSIKIEETELEVRASALPGPYGESIVLRILNPDTLSIPLEKMGIEPKLLSILEKEIERPNGMILSTGPTGSGKTTTLYAFLRKIKTSEIKIITIEDPIEYHLSGVTQTQIDRESGYTFLEGLRHSLRQDPDVIMVGEIRDNNTAKTAIHAALTGHLVLSTLHTNNAAGTIPRLIDLGINPKIIGSALNVSMAQRLLRKLCNACKKKDKPNREEAALIEHILETMLENQKQELKADVIWRANKCAECNHSGYQERIGIFEAILIDEKIEQSTSKSASERDIWRAAKHQEILTMRQDGIGKVLRGITSLEELGRVIDLYTDEQ